MEVLLEIAVSILMVLIEFAVLAVILEPRGVARLLRRLLGRMFTRRSRADGRPLRRPHEAR